MLLQSWPNLGFWPYLVIGSFFTLYVLGFAAEAWLGSRIEQIGKRQAADPAIRPLMGSGDGGIRSRNALRMARLLAEPERSWGVLWGGRLRLYFIILSALAVVAFIAQLVVAWPSHWQLT
jgi:hypothetical protein